MLRDRSMWGGHGAKRRWQQLQCAVTHVNVAPFTFEFVRCNNATHDSLLTLISDDELFFVFCSPFSRARRGLDVHFVGKFVDEIPLASILSQNFAFGSRST